MSALLPVHLICPLGNPASPKVWSGFPHQIMLELRKRGRLGVAEHIRINPVWHLLNIPSHLLLGEFRRGWEGTTLIHHARAAQTNHRIRLLGAGHILHIGTSEFPWQYDLSGLRNHIIIDATWRSWNAGFGRKVPPPRSLLAAMEKRERTCYEKAVHIFTIGQHVRDEVINDYQIPAGKVTAVGTGHGSLTPYHGPKDYGNRKILFVAKGRFAEKGGEQLVEAFRLAHARDPRLSLTIAGRRDYLTRFRKESGITALGYITPGSDTLQRLFEEHSLFVMPSRHDPWGLVYLESLACRTPFVALKRNAYEELSGGGQFGYGLEGESPDELAELLLAALSRPSELAAKGAAGQAYCLSRYTWARVVDGLLAVMDTPPLHE